MTDPFTVVMNNPNISFRNAFYVLVVKNFKVVKIFCYNIQMIKLIELLDNHYIYFKFVLSTTYIFKEINFLFWTHVFNMTTYTNECRCVITPVSCIMVIPL